MVKKAAAPSKAPRKKTKPAPPVPPTYAQLVKKYKGKHLWQVMPPASALNDPKTLFLDPADFVRACESYFAWCSANPVVSEKAWGGAFGVNTHETEHTRPYTTSGLAAFIGVSEETIHRWGNPNQVGYRPDLASAVKAIKNAIREQKLSGAAAGIYNPLIISLDLGMRANRQEQEEKSLETNLKIDESMTLEEKAATFKALLEANK